MTVMDMIGFGNFSSEEFEQYLRLWDNSSSEISSPPRIIRPTYIERPITDPRYTCPITLEPIGIERRYHMCHSCGGIFTRIPFRKWV